MRISLLSIGLIAALSTIAMSARAFEVEEYHRFGNGESRTLRILSTTDTALLTPMIETFLQGNPGVAIEYTSASSAELMTAVMREKHPFDLALSSAMDLQIKLANDGYTQVHHSNEVDLIPTWGNWRNHVFAFSQEPASIVVSPSAFADLEIPRSRQQLISLLRKHPDRFRGRIGTYDVGSSGLGYLFATQDARTSESYWRLMEIMGVWGDKNINKQKTHTHTCAHISVACACLLMTSDLKRSLSHEGYPSTDRKRVLKS